MQKCILHQMPKLIKMLLVLSSLLTVLLRRDDHFHSCRLRRLHNLVRVVGTVRKQIGGINPLNQLTGLAAIRSGTLCNKESDRHTMRIYGQVYLGVEPPFVRLIS